MDRSLFTRRYVLTAVSISAVYLLLSAYLLGFKSDQLVLVLLVNCMLFISKASRRFITGFSIFIFYWVLYDYMKAFPNYLYNPVHIEDLYLIEKRLFGIMGAGGMIITPNEFWALHANTVLDVLSGLFYLTWIPVPLLFAVYLFFKNKSGFIRFSLTFVWINLLGFIIYYLFPAAPPWYVQQHGFTFIAGTPGNTAGLARFDEFFNIQLFKGIYSKGSNVFAAMPSLHSAYPLLVSYYGLKNKMGWINSFFNTIALGIWFSAVYTSHHYLLDVLAGISCSLLGIASINGLFKTKVLRDSTNGFERQIKNDTE